MPSYLNCYNLQMKILGTINIRNVSASSLLWLLFLAFVFMVPISQWACVRLLMACLVFSFFVRSPQSHVILFFRNAWDIILYLLVLLVGLLYSDDLPLGLRVLETNFSFLAMPIVFYKVDDFNKKKLHLIFQTFSFGLIVSSLICLFNAAIKYVNTGDIHAFFFYELTDVLDFQPTYFAYYIIFTISFGLYLFYFHQVWINYKLQLIVLLFLFFILMLTGGLTSFISILLVLSFFVLKFWTNEKTKIRTQSFAIVVVMIIGMFLFSHLYKKLDTPSYKITDHWERLELWESSINANINPWLGVGTGDYKKELNKFYTEHQMKIYAQESYNAHNQYIQILFSNGAMGLIALVFLIGRPLYISVRNQNVLGALTFFPFLIYGMTEVFLGRFQGVVFFALLHQIFLTFYTNGRPQQII